MPARLLTLTAVSVAVAGAMTGCSAESEGGKNIVQSEVASVACPGEATATALPGGWVVPLPDGTVPVDVRQLSNGRVAITGVVPASESDTLHALQQKFASAGLKLTEGEAEEHDAESNFTGSGVTGRWGIRELTGCSSPATRIDVVVRKS
jgi:hypothetical protein